MEHWNNGFWATGTLVYWQNTVLAKILLTRNLINKKISFKKSSFQYSTIPLFHVRGNTQQKSY